MASYQEVLFVFAFRRSMDHSHSLRAATKRIIVALALVVAVSLVVGCAGATEEPPIINPDISGVVTSVDSASGTTIFRVVWTEAMGPRSDFRLDVAQVAVPRSLKVDDGTDHSNPPFPATDLRVGDIVAVTLAGSVAESYPPQGTAGSVVYLGKHQGELPGVPGLDPAESTPTPKSP